MRFTFRILTVAILLLSALASNAQTRDFSFNNSASKEGLTIEQNTRSGLQMRHTLKQMSIVTITDNGYTGDVINSGIGITLPADEGEPNLPSFSRFVAIPNGATAHIEMSYRSMTTIANVDVLPAAPLKFDTDDSPNTYEKNPSIYNKNAFFPEQPVTVSEPFNLRGVQTVAVTVVPYQYNPITKELRVYDDLQFSVRFDNGNGEFGDNRLRSPYWDPILMQNLVNYNQLPVIDYEARMQEWVNNRPEGCEYLIVIPNNENFRQYANQLAEYRIKQGILTEVKSLSDMGCTTTAMMKSYFHNAYNTWDIPPVAVLLLGDHNTNMGQGIPAETTYHSSSYGNCITDNGYADVTGDNLPEMAFSRLVAANANEAQMMVSKQMEYEYTNPNMNASTYDQPITALGWQNERWFQICSEAVGGYWRNHGKHPVRINAIYSGYPGNTWSTNQNTSIVVNYFGPNGLGYIPQTPSELGGWTGGTAAQVVQAVNNGCMLLQHRDHGYYQGWGEPDFSTSNVAQMTNTGKLTFVNTINCQTGTFDHSPECLIEAFMRRTSNNQNAGAVGCIGPKQTSYSFVNDTYVWGMYDQYDPQFLPDFGPYANYEGNWRPAFGNVAGKYFLQQSSWPSNPDKKAITHKMFTSHCDAFLTLYTQVPQTMTVTHPLQITSTTTSISVSAPAGTIIALTRNNIILAVATATGSTQNISFPAQPSNSQITIVGTKQDYKRYVGTINVISEPNLTLTEVSLNDANGNGQLEYGETSSFNMTIKNNGDIASNMATATLSTTMPLLVTITNSTASIPALSPNQTTDLENVFGIIVADNITNNTQLDFTLTMNDGGHQWTTDFNFNAAAPALKIDDIMLVNDNNIEKNNGNGRLDPGETAEVTFNYTNNGGATANNVTATLSSLTQQSISISNPASTTTIVDPGQTVEVTYTVSVSANMPKGENAALKLTLVSGNYSDEHIFDHRVGLEIANFEQGMEDFEWENDPNHPWIITTANPYSGSYCLQSGTIGHNETSTLSILYNVENPDDEIRFFRKTDSELNNDFLRFYIDGTMLHEWSGSVNWREMAFPVTQGEHTFSWVYEKNASGSSGSDHAWIDEVLFPVKHISFACNAGPDQDRCQEAVQLEANALGYETLFWTTSGDGSFNEDDILNPTYTPGEQDLINRVVILTLTATDEQGETLTDEVTIRFHEAASITMDDEGSICEGESIDLTAMVDEAGFTQWETEGDGSFSTTLGAESTYTPGEQDIANGSVILWLKAMSPYSCGDADNIFLLTIHPIEHIEFNMEACGSYNWNGTEYSEDGNYEQTLQSVFGCDSIVTMHLTLIDAYQMNVEVDACDSYEWNGVTYNTSGVYENTFTSIHGCDSTVTMQLNIYPSYYIATSGMGCESFEWEGVTYTESGDYLLGEYQSIHGCDSIRKLNVLILHSPTAGTIDGDNDLDVLYTPVSTYSLAQSVEDATCVWAVEPEEAGTIDQLFGYEVTVTWSDNYKGEATIQAYESNTCGEMLNTLNVMVKNSTDVSEHNVKANLFPNPTNGNITIEAEGMRRITVSNTLGQIVLDKETEGDHTSLNMSQFAVGTYLVRIYTENGTALKRVNVIR